MMLDEAGVTDVTSEEAYNIFKTYAYDGFNALDQEYSLNSTQPCLTSDVTFRHIMAFNYLLYKERSIKGKYLPGVHYTMLSVSPNDNTDFCTCNDCKAVYTREGSIAGTVIDMSNRVSDAMKDTIPGVGVYTIAYWDARNPPKYLTPNENVCVCFCVGGCNNHTFDHTEECAAAGGNARYPFKVWDVERQSPQKPDFNVSNVYDVDCLNRWCEVTDNIYVWYYACNFSYYISPTPNVFNIYNDFKYLAERGASGIYCEGSSRGFSFELLRGYLASRMMWDPLMSEEEFEAYLDEFLMIYYGNGWEYIKEYLYMQDAAGNLQGCFMNNFDWPWDMYNREYYGANYDHFCDQFTQASGATSDSTQKSRIELASIHMHFLGLSATYESDYVNGTSAQRSKYTTRYTWLWNYIKNKGYMQKTREDAFKATSFQEGVGGLNARPNTATEVRDTMTWIFLDFTGSREW
ncbi:MAG: DUF4838 domain-containing protein [Clostridia bacterium]|nr:DUF4838 domain-containing protein [Clostridia bacterium]